MNPSVHQVRRSRGNPRATVRGLRVVRQATDHVALTSSRVRVELRALAADLFRFRATSNQSFSGAPSWAVDPREWPPCHPEIRSGATRVSLKAGGGELRLQLKSGTLQLLDAGGKRLLHSEPDSTAFVRSRAETAFHLSGGESFFGMGESSGPFDRCGSIQCFWTIDVLGHGGIHPGQRNLYTAIPFTVMTTRDTYVGLFWDNPARQHWDLGQTQRNVWTLTAASGEIDLYLFTARSMARIVQRYMELTGSMPLPPRWALGYHQSRYSYKSRKELEAVARELRRRRIPCDALYLDIHHMDGFRVFTFGKSFPRPNDMVARLRRRGFKTVAIVNPGVKVDPRFGVYRRGRSRGAYVRDSSGRRDYVGEVWPGRAVFPDFLNGRVRRWWGREQARLQRIGIAGFWNDMNEPASFNTSDKTLPAQCLHESEFGPVRHSEGHNVYGMQMARASRDGALHHHPRERPFIITRAAYAGGQRHATIWTGDNSSTWEHLADSVQMILSLGISGFPFCGSDAGGFLDNCTPELYARWMQLASFTPFFRNHTMEGTLPHEPWRFGRDVERIVRAHIRLRYQLLPYWYALFAEAHHTRSAIVRPLAWHYPDDPVAIRCGDQFLVGHALLVAPVLQQGQIARSVYLPKGAWYDFWTGRRYRGRQHIVAAAPLDRIPLFARAGALLPMSQPRQYTSHRPDRIIQLHVWPGASGVLQWYEDDGCSMDYQQGAFHARRISMESKRGGIELKFGPTSGSYRSRVATWRLVLHAANRLYRVAPSQAHVGFDAQAKLWMAEMSNPYLHEPVEIRLT